MKKVELILRDANGKPHIVKIDADCEVDIDIYGGNMVMNKPYYYDTNKGDERKRFCPDGGMEFIASPEVVEKFNTFKDSLDAQKYIHGYWREIENIIDRLGLPIEI